MRNASNWDELNGILRELFGFKDQYTSQNLDFKQRQIKNAHPSIDDYDYVVRKELIDRLGGGISSPPLITRAVAKTYDKITFGIGVGAPITVGINATPPYIWSNSLTGRPEIGFISANTVPTGADAIFDIKKNGASIFGATKIMLPAGTGNLTVVSFGSIFNAGLSFSRRDVITCDITQVGSTIAGQGISIVIFCKLS